MTVMLAVVMMGVLGGLATGGRVSALGRLRIRAWPLLGGAVTIQASLGAFSGGIRWMLAVAGCAGVAGWCVLNRGRGALWWGLAMVTLGVTANAVVMAANGGMPVSASALSSAGLPRAMNLAAGHLYKHVAMNGSSRIGILGDAIPVHLVRAVLSPGDVLMLGGIAVVAFAATRRGDRREAGSSACSTGQVGQSNMAPSTAAVSY